MKTQLDTANKIFHARVSGDLTSTNAGQVRTALADIINADNGKRADFDVLCLDLTEAKLLDSVGLNLVVTILRAVQRTGGRMQLRYKSPNVLRTLQFTRLNQHVELIAV